MKLVILGAGNIGFSLAALTGSRAGIETTLWSRRWAARKRVSVCLFSSGDLCAAAEVQTEPSLERALAQADLVICTLPSHIRDQLIRNACTALECCKMFVAWEGTGFLRTTLEQADMQRPIVAGLQRSPILCRLRDKVPVAEPVLVDLLGVRSQVVAGTIRAGDSDHAGELLAAILPFHFLFAPDYDCVALSPGNPLIHPARLFSHRASTSEAGRSTLFYAGWDVSASSILLDLHGELAHLRDQLGLPRQFLQTLRDDDTAWSPHRLTGCIASQLNLASIELPLKLQKPGAGWDLGHRFFSEDLEQGLGYILQRAAASQIAMPKASAIWQWYQQLRTGVGLPENLPC